MKTRVKPKAKINREIMRELRVSLDIARQELAHGVVVRNKDPLRRSYRMLLNCTRLLDLLLE